MQKGYAVGMCSECADKPKKKGYDRVEKLEPVPNSNTIFM